MSAAIKQSEAFSMRKTSSCPVCATYDYVLRYTITSDIENFLTVFGNPTYPLSKYKAIYIDNEQVTITGNVGRSTIRVKYKKEVEHGKQLFAMQLCSWIEHAHGVKVEL